MADFMGPLYIQNAVDGPGILGDEDENKYLVVRNKRITLAVMPVPGNDGSGPQGYYVVGGADNLAPATILSRLKEVDGDGSGLDADLLDGKQGAEYLLVDGSVVGGTANKQQFTNGIATPTITPITDDITGFTITPANSVTPIFVVDTANNRVGINTTPAAVFHMVIPDTPITGTGLSIGNTGEVELITNTVDRDFSGTPNWTGTNWAVNSGALKHTAGSTTAATLSSSFFTSDSIISGRQYALTYTISGATTGTVIPRLGTGLGTSQGVNGTYIDYLLASGDNVNLTFTPTSAFDGSIDNISLQRISANVVMKGSGKVGIGTTNPLLALEVVEYTNTPLNVKRMSAITSGSAGGFNAVHETSGVALDGFGVHQSFRIKDNTSGTTYTIGTVGAVREGAMNTGGIVFRTTTSNVTNERMRLSTQGHIGLGITVPAARIHVVGNASFSAWGTNGVGLRFAAATYTDSSTAASGTASNAVGYAFGRPTFAAANASVTMTNAATLYVENSPAAGTNTTLTNKYAIWVDDGDVRFDGHILTGDATANTNTPSGATAYKMPIYNQTGTLLGYIPIYGSAW